MNPIGPWRPDRLLGQGAMAEVWLCEGPDGARAAVKWLTHDSPAMVERFVEEARVLASLAHPGIVRFVGRGLAEGRLWMAMAFVDGSDLRLFAEKLRTRPPDERGRRARSIARSLAESLGYLHAQGYVHRDVKPSNVLYGADDSVILTDFGVVSAIGVRPACVVGTRAYAAPEQLEGAVTDPRADQFGLGATLNVLLTGRPFGGRPPSQLDPTIPADLESIVLRLCADDPVRRFEDMAEVAEALGGAPAAAATLAGRQGATDVVAAALDRVASGTGLTIRVVGARGSGRRWLAGVARDAASRRGVGFVATEERASLDIARTRIAHGERILLMTAAPEPSDVTVDLAPLSVADLRRTVYSVAPRTEDTARIAERLHRLTGGNAGMVVALLAKHTQGDILSLPAAVVIDPARWLAGMDLDEEAVAGALAVLPGAAEIAVIEQIAATPAELVLPSLVERGVAARAGSWWVLAAEALRVPLLDALGDADGLRERAAQALAETRSPAPVDAALALDADGIERALAVPVPDGVADLVAGGVADGVADGAADEATSARWLRLGVLRWEEGDVVRALAAYRRARAMTADPARRSRASVGIGISSMLAGDLPAALDALSSAATDAALAREVDREVIALVDLCEARALAGEFDEALRCGNRALSLAQGLRDRRLECAALRHLGMALLDAGRPGEAAPKLAEASALARAVGDDEERVAAHVLRARAVMDERPGDRAAAAAALDRLLPLLGETGPDPEGFRLLMRATWARAAATLGDTRQYQRALAEADLELAGARIVVRRRAQEELGRARALAIGVDAGGPT